MRIFEWLRWFFWDRWHGVSVSAFDERRTTQPDAPAVEIGNLRIPRWFVYLLVVLVFIVLIVLALRLFGVVLATEDRVYGYGMSQVYDPVSACVVREKATGRTFIAIDCLVSYWARWLWFQVPAVLVFLSGLIVGFIAGWVARSLKAEEE